MLPIHNIQEKNNAGIIQQIKVRIENLIKNIDAAIQKLNFNATEAQEKGK